MKRTSRGIFAFFVVLIGSMLVFFMIGWTLKSLSLDTSVIEMFPQTPYLNWAAGSEVIYYTLLGEYIAMILLSIVIGLICLTHILLPLAFVMWVGCMLFWPLTGLILVLFVATAFYKGYATDIRA